MQSNEIKKGIRKQSKYLKSKRVLEELKETLNGVQRVFLVCGSSFQKLPIKKQWEQLQIPTTFFSDFTANPDYESVEKGIACFQENQCDFVAAVGGGSAMDVAKCIKLAVKAPLLAIPTTAGSGSEATHFAVVYRKGEKQSLEDEEMLPDYVLLDPENLKTLPLLQRKATMLDALCHSVESYWSVRSNEESKQYAAQALKNIMNYKEGYLNNTSEGNAGMMEAAHVAGKAINITRTTAAHAMCYKLTTKYQLPHGQAAALVLPVLWRFMLKQPLEVTDSRGSAYLEQVFQDLANYLGEKTSIEAVEKLEKLLEELELNYLSISEEDLDVLTASVNVDRLGNHPMRLDQEALKQIYKKACRKEG